MGSVTQLCSNLCDPVDHSSPGSSVHGILQVRILQWVSMPPPRDLRHPGIEPESPTLKADSLLLSHEESPNWHPWPATKPAPVTASVQFNHSVMSDFLPPHESQHASPPCPSPSPGVHWDSRPLSQWCHPAISSSVIPFPSCPQSLPASESFQWVNSSHEVAKVLEFQL